MLIEKFEAKGIKFAVYENGSKFALYVGGIKRASYPSLKGAMGAANRIIKAN